MCTLCDAMTSRSYMVQDNGSISISGVDQLGSVKIKVKKNVKS